MSGTQGAFDRLVVDLLPPLQRSVWIGGLGGLRGPRKPVEAGVAELRKVDVCCALGDEGVAGEEDIEEGDRAWIVGPPAGDAGLDLVRESATVAKNLTQSVASLCTEASYPICLKHAP